MASGGDVAAWVSFVEVEDELVALRLVDGQASIVSVRPDRRGQTRGRTC